MNQINPRAGQLANASELVDVPKLITAYFAERPDPRVPEQRVAFGTSGHRGSSFDRGGSRAWCSPGWLDVQSLICASVNNLRAAGHIVG